jgi:hypothetical protein
MFRASCRICVHSWKTDSAKCADGAHTRSWSAGQYHAWANVVLTCIVIDIFEVYSKQWKQALIWEWIALQTVRDVHMYGWTYILFSGGSSFSENPLFLTRGQAKIHKNQWAKRQLLTLKPSDSERFVLEIKQFRGSSGEICSFRLPLNPERRISDGCCWICDAIWSVSPPSRPYARSSNRRSRTLSDIQGAHCCCVHRKPRTCLKTRVFMGFGRIW